MGILIFLTEWSSKKLINWFKEEISLKLIWLYCKPNLKLPLKIIKISKAKRKVILMISNQWGPQNLKSQNAVSQHLKFQELRRIICKSQCFLWIKLQNLIQLRTNGTRSLWEIKKNLKINKFKNYMKNRQKIKLYS